MNKEKINKTYNTFKDNLNIILLVPTIVGGLWQLLELSSMSTSFIRFFSFTQLVADGLLILFILTIFFISYRIVGGSFSAKSFSFNSENPTPLWYGIITTSVSIIMILFLYPELKKIYDKQNLTIPEITLIIPIVTLLLGGTLIGIISIAENFISIKKNIIKEHLSKKFIKEIAKIFYKLLIIFSFFLFLKFVLIDLNPHMSNFRRHILFPEHLLNKEILDKRLMKENHLNFKPKLIYYNDKYFFYEVIDTNKNKKMLIVDFSALIYK